MQWHCQHVLTSVEVRLILEGGCTHTSETAPPASVARGWVPGSTVYGLENPRSSSSLQLSLGPGALCVREATAPC